MFAKQTPAWIIAGASALAGVAGCINAVGFLGFHHQAVSHLTGTLTGLGIEFARADRMLALHALGVLLLFFLGCVLGGVIIRRDTLIASRRYGFSLVGESVLLLVAAWIFRRQLSLGEYLAAAACGLQNAVTTIYSGAAVRTTHVTGIITDLGIAVGYVTRREPVDTQRLKLYFALLGGFFLGGVLGTLGFLRLGYDILLIPAAFVGVLGVAQLLSCQRLRGSVTSV